MKKLKRKIKERRQIWNWHWQDRLKTGANGDKELMGK